MLENIKKITKKEPEEHIIADTAKYVNARDDLIADLRKMIIFIVPNSLKWASFFIEVTYRGVAVKVHIGCLSLSFYSKITETPVAKVEAEISRLPSI